MQLSRVGLDGIQSSSTVFIGLQALEIIKAIIGPLFYRMKCLFR